MDKTLAATAAVYIVELVKKHDAMCGGPTQIAMLYEEGGLPYIGEFSRDSIDKCAARLMAVSEGKKEREREEFRALAKDSGFKHGEILILDGL